MSTPELEIIAHHHGRTAFRDELTELVSKHYKSENITPADMASELDVMKLKLMHYFLQEALEVAKKGDGFSA